VVDGNADVNLTAVRVIATESRTPGLSATSPAIDIRVESPVPSDPGGGARTELPIWQTWTGAIVLAAALAAAAAAWVGAARRRRAREAEPTGGVAPAPDLAQGEWESVPHPRPPPTTPPNPDDPQMQLLEAEWSRVIASRHTDAASAPGDTEAEFKGPARTSRPHAPDPAPEEPGRPAKMTSSDTETERRAGETDAEIDVKKRRAQR
jgi:hypothetical protein